MINMCVYVCIYIYIHIYIYIYVALLKGEAIPVLVPAPRCERLERGEPGRLHKNNTMNKS